MLNENNKLIARRLLRERARKAFYLIFVVTAFLVLTLFFIRSCLKQSLEEGIDKSDFIIAPNETSE